MNRKALFAFLMVFVLVAFIGCVSTAEFKSLDDTESGEPQILRGKLTKPNGDGPFPAVVLLHGCAGPGNHYSDWISRFQQWGFVTLMVNSFGPRGESNICGPGRNMLIPPHRRALDAHGAKLFLADLPYVDQDRIAVVGWSHGGSSAVEAVQGHYKGGPFKAAVAYYPYCKPMSKINAPLYVLIGENDDWTPAFRCKQYIIPENSEHELILKIYPKAYHGFDYSFSLRNYKGHKVGRNSSAAFDSYDQVRTFLEKYLTTH